MEMRQERELRIPEVASAAALLKSFSLQIVSLGLADKLCTDQEAQSILDAEKEWFRLQIESDSGKPLLAKVLWIFLLRSNLHLLRTIFIFI